LEPVTSKSIALPAAIARERGASALPDPDAEVVLLFEQTNAGLMRYVLSLGVSMHDAEEIAQEVFLSLFRHLQDGKPRTNLRGWVFRVAHNLSLKHLNSGRRMREVVLPSTDERPPEALDPGPDPEERFLALQNRDRMLAVVRALPEQDRCCLSLRAEGLRYREIGEILSMSLGAVAGSLERSIARLMRAEAR